VIRPYHYSPLLTDFYQLTMAYGYWKLGMHEQESTFHLLFRRNPFKGNYSLSCGLAAAVDFLTQWHFDKSDLDYLANLKNSKQEALFPADFLQYLSQLRFTCDVDAVPEGTIVFPHTPLVRVQGPILQCQLIESALLNIINFQTLIATKATRVCRAAAGDTVLEFGMRRAQGPDGAISASRAAYIGGCHATSNTLAGKLFDIPVRGTHAHSWVTAFENEQAAFDAYASVMPDNCILLVDTYNTIEGVKHAINTGKQLRQQGAELLGIRLDSGDMATLSKQARKLLDDAGFKNTVIVASNSLDEYVIQDFKQKKCNITAWGVGTNLATAYDQPALDGVYKLGALRDTNGQWQSKLKLSEQEIKVSNPGRHQVRRFFQNEKYITDVIYDLDLGISDNPDIVLLDTDGRSLTLDDYDACVDLLVPVLRNGKLVDPLPAIHDIRDSAIANTNAFQQMHDDRTYPVGLEKQLHQVKRQLIDKKQHS
jgi:nicotinate phosphoribosyltransferase